MSCNLIPSYFQYHYTHFFLRGLFCKVLGYNSYGCPMASKPPSVEDTLSTLPTTFWTRWPLFLEVSQIAPHHEASSSALLSPHPLYAYIMTSTNSWSILSKMFYVFKLSKLSLKFFALIKNSKILFLLSHSIKNLGVRHFSCQTITSLLYKTLVLWSLCHHNIGVYFSFSSTGL